MRARLHTLLARVRELFGASRLEAERDEEFRFHIEMQTEHNRRLGMSPGEARRAALVSFGGVERYREATCDARGIAVLGDVLRDTRFACRRLRRSPAFSLGVVATIGVGAGAAVAIGTLVHGVLLRPLPYDRPHELVHVAFVTPGLDGGREHAHSTATFAHLRDGAISFAAIGAYYVNDAVNLTDGEDPQRVAAVMATPGLWDVLAVVPALGGLLSQSDAEQTGASPVLLGHDLWRQRYGADSSIVGRVIEVNRSPRRVTGVLPAGFDFPQPGPRVWFPEEARVERAALNSRYLNVVARLRDGVRLQDAQAELRALVLAIPERFPDITQGQIEQSRAHADVRPLRDWIVAPVREQLRVLGLTMLYVLLIACANVTNLFLVRSERLRHEIAVTIALGAGRLALARRLLTEGALLGAAGGLVALPLVAAAVRTSFGFSPQDIPRLHEIRLGAETLLVVLLLSSLIGALVGVLAFVRTRRMRLGGGLRASTRTTTGAVWRRVQQGLVATQIGLALALVLSAGLMGRSLWNLRQVDLGFAPQQGTVFDVTLPFREYRGYGHVAAFHTTVLDRLRALPGVRAAEAALEVPLVPENPLELSMEFDAVGTGRSERGAANMATPDYFGLMGIPLLHGRSFLPGDVRADLPAVVLSASLARALFGETDAVGRSVRPPTPGPDDRFFRVVGVVGDVPRWRIEDGPARMAYFPMLRDGDGLPADSVRTPIVMRSAQYALRSDLPLGTLAPVIRAAVREADPRVPVTNITSLPALVDRATARVRLTMWLLAVAAAAALLLGLIGVYSVVSYTVAGRQREFGVRLALGASPRGLQHMVLREGAVVAAAGAAAGVLTAGWGARITRSMLYEVSPTEPALYASATLLLLAVALAGTVLPAQRAARVDPLEVMRGE